MPLHGRPTADAAGRNGNRRGREVPEVVLQVHQKILDVGHDGGDGQRPPVPQFVYGELGNVDGIDVNGTHPPIPDCIGRSGYN